MKVEAVTYEDSSLARNSARLRDLPRLGEAAHRQVHEPPRRLLRVLGEQLLEQRACSPARAERVHAHAAARELDAQLA